ncbi:uncharacterized protein LOC125237533 isoform X1 [Leguminivora glycinivorella]|uniref:uncharacterized protein LOC125237533 isoform X1 n=1 Tax=Leguminivora glycinivorella TaxID=1035111 RepID=UPI00200C0659|nr:uncharacterized protein LOC125237533 isoform X1 [Leguminivora glycinivorella]
MRRRSPPRSADLDPTLNARRLALRPSSYLSHPPLDHEYAAEVKDVIVNPPAEGKYEKLKAELISRLSASREKELKRLLVHEELGDRKPSQFLRHLQHLAGPQVHEELLRSIWINRLPMNIQAAIASQPTPQTLDTLANTADRVWDLAPPNPQVASTSQTCSAPGPQTASMDYLAQQIAELTKEIHEMRAERNTRSRPRTRGKGSQRYGRSRSRGTSQGRSQSSYRRWPVCWYHSKFQSQATKCLKPCDFVSGNGQGNL